MTTAVTDEQVRQLVERAKPYTLALLRWGPERHRAGADAIEREHQRRMVGLRADGTIAILLPVGAETLAGAAVMTVSPDGARAILAGDPCVRAGIMVAEVHACRSFPGDSLPA
ncbi:MAG TPA: hypothetical protein VIL48_08465 [Acidimicrobiales bacterium]